MLDQKGFAIVEIVVVVVVLFVIATGLFFITDNSKNLVFDKPDSKKSAVEKFNLVEYEGPVNEQFGFLGGGPGGDDAVVIASVGAGWVRPHLGPFVWDIMQPDENSEITFEQADKLVQSYQQYQISILATLWPFADWDQVQYPDAKSCEVSRNDEFLPRPKTEKDNKVFGVDDESEMPDEKKDGVDYMDESPPSYLPLHRCKPYNWENYQDWVSQVVERYDGDGVDDMLGLANPIKHWEVMNEPDLSSSPDMFDPGLDFFQGTPGDYAELLIQTSESIRETDPDAKVLIAGAAGGSDQFLNFYREVFQNDKVFEAFDIANVHCISNDEYDSFNVEPYQKMLQEFGIRKPIWVTEAEAIISQDPDVNATQTLLSTQEALKLGAKKIFFTRFGFDADKNGFFPEKKPIFETPTVSGTNPQQAFQEIFYAN